MTGSQPDRSRCEPGMAFGFTQHMIRVPVGRGPYAARPSTEVEIENPS